MNSHHFKAKPVALRECSVPSRTECSSTAAAVLPDGVGNPAAAPRWHPPTVLLGACATWPTTTWCRRWVPRAAGLAAGGWAPRHEYIQRQLSHGLRAVPAVPAAAVQAAALGASGHGSTLQPNAYRAGVRAAEQQLCGGRRRHVPVGGWTGVGVGGGTKGRGGAGRGGVRGGQARARARVRPI